MTSASDARNNRLGQIVANEIYAGAIGMTVARLNHMNAEGIEYVS